MKVVEVIFRPQRPYFRCILLNFRELYSCCDIHLCAEENIYGYHIEDKASPYSPLIGSFMVPS